MLMSKILYGAHHSECIEQEIVKTTLILVTYVSYHHKLITNLATVDFILEFKDTGTQFWGSY